VSAADPLKATVVAHRAAIALKPASAVPTIGPRPIVVLEATAADRKDVRNRMTVVQKAVILKRAAEPRIVDRDVLRASRKKALVATQGAIAPTQKKHRTRS
jgi:hypothetical protein